MGARKKVPRDAKPSAGKPWDSVSRIARSLPETAEGTSYGTPAYFVRDKLFARLHQDRESLVVKIDLHDRERRMKVDPVSFFITDHYRNYPMMQVRLATVDAEDLRELLEESWRRSAPESLWGSLSK